MSSVLRQLAVAVVLMTGVSCRLKLNSVPFSLVLLLNGKAAEIPAEYSVTVCQTVKVSVWRWPVVNEPGVVQFLNREVLAVDDRRRQQLRRQLGSRKKVVDCTLALDRVRNPGLKRSVQQRYET